MSVTLRPQNGIRKWWLFLLITGLIISIVFALLTPWNISNLSSHPHPAQSYSDALHLVDILRGKEKQKMNPVGRLQLMSHNSKTERAIILVHGYTSCPEQFHELGQRFYDAGYNVLIAPLPHHGLADRMTDEQGKLTAGELADYADRTVDIARGLGQEVVMIGLSAGGVTTAWAAQNRHDIDQAIIISPAFGFKKIPTFLTGATMNIYTLLPDAFEWWDPILKEKVPPAYSYPRYSRHALVEILRLGFATRAGVLHNPPGAKRITVILNANDTTVNNELTKDVVTIWQAQKPQLSTYEFDASLKLPHDIIDPSKSNQRVDIVYPRLIELVTRP